MADSSEMFEEYLENVLCILEGKGFKVTLDDEGMEYVRVGIGLSR